MGFMDSLYDNREVLRPYLGADYTPPRRFPHCTPVLVAELSAENEDGWGVRLFECAAPSRFFKVEATAQDGRGTYTLSTGSDQGELACAIARALTQGMLGIYEGPLK